jgi:hypothetical protein
MMPIRQEHTQENKTLIFTLFMRAQPIEYFFVYNLWFVDWLVIYFF